MAITQRNIKPTVFESVTGESLGTFTLNVEKNFLLDGHYPFLVADPIIKQGASVVPGSAYTLHKDTAASDQETAAAGSTVTLYGAITITNVAYVGVELNFSGKNYGAYVSNEANVSYTDEQLTSKSGPGSDNFIEEGEPVVFASALGVDLISDNSGEIVLWDSGTVYNVAGTLARKEGITATATGKATNQNKDPLDQLNSDFWYIPDDETDLIRYANRGDVIGGKMHSIHDRSSSEYQQNIKIGKKKVSGAQKEFFEVMLDGSVVTGNATLEAIFDVGGGNEYPYLDIYAPDVAGTRTLLDMGEYITAPQSVSGENDVLGALQDDRMQGHIHFSGFANDGFGSGVYTANATRDTPGVSVTQIAQTGGAGITQASNSEPKTDYSSNGTPRTGLTTRPKELTEGISYIVVMVAA